jgi:hypothetical protein
MHATFLSNLFMCYITEQADIVKHFFIKYLFLLFLRLLSVMVIHIKNKAKLLCICQLYEG